MQLFNLSTHDILERFFIIHDIPLDMSYSTIKNASSTGVISNLTPIQRHLVSTFNFAKDKDIIPILYIFQFISKNQLMSFIRFYHTNIAVFDGGIENMPIIYKDVLTMTFFDLIKHLSDHIQATEMNFYYFIILFKAYFISSTLKD